MDDRLSECLTCCCYGDDRKHNPSFKKALTVVTPVYLVRSEEGWIQQLNSPQETQARSIVLLHHSQSWFLSVGVVPWGYHKWLPLLQTSPSHTIMPMGRDQGEGHGGKIGPSSWVSFFPQGGNTSPKPPTDFIISYYHNWVTWASYSCKGGWGMSASVFQVLEWKGTKIVGSDYGISKQCGLP